MGIFLHIFRQSQPVSCSSLCHNELLGMDLYLAALQTWQFSNTIPLMLCLIWNFLMLHQRFLYTLQLHWRWLVSINFPTISVIFNTGVNAAEFWIGKEAVLQTRYCWHYQQWLMDVVKDCIYLRTGQGQGRVINSFTHPPIPSEVRCTI